MARIFISYRRDDSSGWAGRLYDRLSQHLGRDNVFMDIDTIESGMDFVQVIEQAVGSCDAMIAVIGRHWLTITDDTGRRRLDHPADFVWLEIAAALGRNIRVIPALVQGASMPRSADLPDVLKTLARRNAHEINDRRFRYDVDQLIKVLDKVLGVANPARDKKGAVAEHAEERETPRTGAQDSPLPGSITPSETSLSPPERPTVQSLPARPTAVPSEVQGLLERMRSSDLNVRARVAAGNALAQQGDPRFRADAWFLADESLLGFVEIPAGPFLMGSHRTHDARAFDNEFPRNEVRLPRYFIGRYPVTVAQFRAFVEGGDSRPENPVSLQGIANHPVVWVSWYEARQYCDWLTERLWAWPGTPKHLGTLMRDERWRVDLPSETEWEKAARGTDGRIYPWGNRPDLNRANYKGTGINTSSTVGCFPGGASPYGVEDLSGNVWEWTRSLWGKYPYPYDQPERMWHETLQADRVPRVTRGGPFSLNLRYVRCAHRGLSGPDDSHRAVGFRVVVRPAF